MIIKAFKKSSFERIIDKLSFLHPYWCRKKLDRYYWNETHQVNVKKAPQPSDILWNGIGCRRGLKQKRKFQTNLNLIIFFVLQLIFLVFVKVQVRKIQVNMDNKTISDSLNLITALIIALFNVFIGNFFIQGSILELVPLLN